MKTTKSYDCIHHVEHHPLTTPCLAGISQWALLNDPDCGTSISPTDVAQTLEYRRAYAERRLKTDYGFAIGDEVRIATSDNPCFRRGVITGLMPVGNDDFGLVVGDSTDFVLPLMALGGWSIHRA
jgi:hypothetical protein